MIFRYTTILAFLVFSQQAFAQQSLTIDQAIAIGIENNYNIKIGDRNIRIAQNNDSWARAGRYPTVSAGLGLTSNLTRETNQASFLRGDYFIGGIVPSLNINWNLYNGGLINYQKERFEQSIIFQDALKKQNVLNTIREIQQNYYIVLLEESRLQVVYDVLSLSKDRLAYENIRKDFGQGNSFSILQFENALLSDSATFVLQKNAVSVAKSRLLRSMNMQARADDYVLSEILTTTLEQLEKNKIKEALIANNPNIKALELNRQLASINSNISKTRTMPSIGFTSGINGSLAGFQIFGENPNTGDNYPFLNGETYRWNTAINATYLLFDGGVARADYQNARIQEEIAEFDILETTASLINQLDILFKNYDTQIQQVSILDLQLEKSTQNIQIAEERLKNGAITSLDYRNIQLAYLNTAFNRINAIYNLLSIKTDIAFLIGQ